MGQLTGCRHEGQAIIHQLDAAVARLVSSNLALDLVVLCIAFGRVALVFTRFVFGSGRGGTGRCRRGGGFGRGLGGSRSVCARAATIGGCGPAFADIVSPLGDELFGVTGDFGVGIGAQAVHVDTNFGRSQKVFGSCNPRPKLVENAEKAGRGVGAGRSFEKVSALCFDLTRGQRHD